MTWTKSSCGVIKAVTSLTCDPNDPCFVPGQWLQVWLLGFSDMYVYTENLYSAFRGSKRFAVSVTGERHGAGKYSHIQINGI